MPNVTCLALSLNINDVFKYIIRLCKLNHIIDETSIIECVNTIETTIVKSLIIFFKASLLVTVRLLSSIAVKW